MCFMFLMDTGLFISNVAGTLTLFQWAGDTITDNIPFENRLLASNVAAGPYAICEVFCEILNVCHILKPWNLNHLQFITGDAIVIWRAISLWPHCSYWVRGGLYFLFLGDVGVYWEVATMHPLTYFSGWLVWSSQCKYITYTLPS